MLRIKKKPTAKTFNANSLLNDRSSFAYAESYKSLRTNLEFSTFGGEIKTILFTSSIPDEGKSSVVVNTAKTLADSNHKVLVIDADLRSPSLGRYLRVRRDVHEGLSTFLSGKAKLETAIYEYVPGGYDVMLSGPIPPNPAELLSRPKTLEMLKELKEKYDYILIDTPPVGVVSDAAIVSAFVDGAIFVVRHNFSNKELAKNSIKHLKASKVNILGAVLNDYDAAKDLNAMRGYEYQYHYDPYSKKND